MTSYFKETHVTRKCIIMFLFLVIFFLSKSANSERSRKSPERLLNNTTTKTNNINNYANNFNNNNNNNINNNKNKNKLNSESQISKNVVVKSDRGLKGTMIKEMTDKKLRSYMRKKEKSKNSKTLRSKNRNRFNILYKNKNNLNNSLKNNRLNNINSTDSISQKNWLNKKGRQIKNITRSSKNKNVSVIKTTPKWINDPAELYSSTYSTTGDAEKLEKSLTTQRSNKTKGLSGSFEEYQLHQPDNEQELKQQPGYEKQQLEHIPSQIYYPHQHPRYQPQQIKQQGQHQQQQKEQQKYYNQSKLLVDEQKVNLQQQAQHLTLQQQHLQQLQQLQQQQQQQLDNSPIKECDIKSGNSIYHVTVVRGECCKKKQNGDQKQQVAQNMQLQQSLQQQLTLQQQQSMQQDQGDADGMQNEQPMLKKKKHRKYKIKYRKTPKTFDNNTANSNTLNNNIINRVSSNNIVHHHSTFNKDFLGKSEQSMNHFGSSGRNNYHPTASNKNTTPSPNTQTQQQYRKNYPQLKNHSKLGISQYTKEQKYKKQRIPKKKQKAQETPYEISDFESVFLLDRLTKVENSIARSRREIRDKIGDLMTTMSNQPSNKEVEKQLQHQQQQLQQLQQQLQQTYNMLSDQQYKQLQQQLTELTQMREDHTVQMKKQQEVLDQTTILQLQQQKEKTGCSKNKKINNNNNDLDNKYNKNDRDANNEYEEIDNQLSPKVHNNNNNKNNNNNNNNDDDFNIVSNASSNSPKKNIKKKTKSNNFRSRLQNMKYHSLRRNVRHHQHATYNEELYSMPLRDEPGRNENSLLNKIHREFSLLRQDLTDTKGKLEVVKLRMKEEIMEKERVKGELEIREEELKLTTEELNEASKKQETLAGNLTEALRWKEHLIEQLNEEKKQHNESKQHLTDVVSHYHELKGKYEGQTALIGVIRRRMKDCINNQLTLSCEFEDPRLCGFKQDNYSDNLDWVRSNGKEKHNSYTRPTKDQTCQNDRGHFLYVKATERLIGQVARMKTPRMFGFAPQCIEFYYWISGKHVGTLNVYTEVPDEGVLSPVWRVFGNQGDLWIKARLDVPIEVVRAGYKVVFEGILDRGLLGDIALDDFKINEGTCIGEKIKEPL